jgi:hypothetical protein
MPDVLGALAQLVKALRRWLALGAARRAPSLRVETLESVRERVGPGIVGEWPHGHALPHADKRGRHLLMATGPLTLGQRPCVGGERSAKPRPGVVRQLRPERLAEAVERLDEDLRIARIRQRAARVAQDRVLLPEAVLAQ